MTFEEMIRKEIETWKCKEPLDSWDRGYIRGLENALLFHNVME
jgi:hypothetical protein